MRVSYRRLSLFLLFFLVQAAVCSATSNFLTPEERRWLNEHPVITIGPDPDALPFEHIDSDGFYRGLSADYLAYISADLGVSFKVAKAQNWAELMAMAKLQQIDLLPAIVSSAPRREFLTFTAPWLSVPGVVLSTQPFTSVADLADKTVVVVDGSIWDDYVSAHPVDVRLIRVEDSRTALELTALSGVDAMVTNLATATEMIHQLGISNLRVVLRLKHSTDISFGVRKDWPELVSILNKTLTNMDPAVKENIRQRWLKLEEIPWWRNASFQRIGLFSLGGFILIIAFFVIWNQSLKRQVRKRSEALEQAHQRLVRAAKMESIGQLAAGVAHEVKNPLAIISMGVEFLNSTPDRDATEQQILTDMDGAVQRADRVIRGLLDYSHYSKLERRPGDINEVIKQSLHLVDHEMKKHQIDVCTNLDILETACFDFTRIQQVFINLFVNSAQAMGEGGRLEITSKMDRLSPIEAEPSPDYQAGLRVIRVTVTDNGPGIGDTDCEKIFDPFYTTKDIGQGTGLGLSESRNIMELHNGTLQLMNCKPTGACAVVILPCDKGAEDEENSTC